MQWFKHACAASHDALISKIEIIFGLEGYARFFKLIEGIAANMKPANGFEPTLALTWRQWESMLSAKHKGAVSFLEFLAAQGEVVLEETGNKPETKAKQSQNKSRMFHKQTGNILKITFPKIKEIKDEYASRSGVSRDKLPHKRQSTETETDKKPAANAAPIAFKGQILKITECENHAFLAAFSWLDLPSQYARMDAWLVSHPKNQKKDFARFANNWLSGEPHPKPSKGLPELKPLY